MERTTKVELGRAVRNAKGSIFKVCVINRLLSKSRRESLSKVGPSARREDKVSGDNVRGKFCMFVERQDNPIECDKPKLEPDKSRGEGQYTSP